MHALKITQIEQAASDLGRIGTKAQEGGLGRKGGWAGRMWQYLVRAQCELALGWEPLGWTPPCQPTRPTRNAGEKLIKTLPTSNQLGHGNSKGTNFQFSCMWERACTHWVRLEVVPGVAWSCGCLLDECIDAQRFNGPKHRLQPIRLAVCVGIAQQ